MKRIIRLTESDFHRLIKESVKRILKESVWYGDTKPLENIIKMADEIINNYEYVNEPDYENRSDDGYDMHAQLYEWAKKVRNEAEEWIGINSSNASMNGGENW